MNSLNALVPSQLSDLLLAVAPTRPVFIWGPPGIGKSALVEQFALEVGLECVSLLGSQLAPEDLIGVPQISGGKTRFHPPAQIARDVPYCLFLDELNACTPDVQKAFYSLIHERRIGEYRLPEGSVVIGAGNRAEDSAIVRPMSSALLNRMLHVQLKASARDWLAWAYGAGIHPLVLEYLQQRPDHLWSAPPKTEEPFSSPRAWHMLSDALHALGTQDAFWVEVAAGGCLSSRHAVSFRTHLKQTRGRYRLEALLAGEVSWPREPQDRDLLYFLAQSLRARLVKELPPEKAGLSGENRAFANRAKTLLKELAAISLEVAQTIAAESEDGSHLPEWLMVELVRDLPRLVERDRAR
ncbi:hypothetical protein HNR42_002266 [Deinobacterium chartae]|uniref:AAA+ ATPase domain-containing protein n=1 Tax=Deinobacterium chartae TaxID=521158 RepID=A0A841HZ73_9DEIO|nr:MoxR family ATPase [Deinobacterium chartae]MBB6098831.1 hypothetical protein [Deinobacterium chartae]